MLTPARSLLCVLFLAACAAPPARTPGGVRLLPEAGEPLSERTRVRGSAPEGEAEDPWWRSFAARLKADPPARAPAPADDDEVGQDLRVLARLAYEEAAGAAEVFAEAIAERSVSRPVLGHAGPMAAAALPALTADDGRGPAVSAEFLSGLLEPVLAGAPELFVRRRGQVVLAAGFEDCADAAALWGALQRGNRGLELEAEAYVLQVPRPSALPPPVRWARGIDFGGSEALGWAPSEASAQALLDWSREARGSRIVAEPRWRLRAGAESLRGWSRPGAAGDEGAGLGLRALALTNGALRVEVRLRLMQLDEVRPLFPRRFEDFVHRDQRRPATRRRLTGLRMDQTFEAPAGRWRWFPLGKLPGVEGRAGPRYGLLLRIRSAERDQ